MTGDELRQLFLRFFEEKGHTIVPSAPLIPKGDPTLLFTSAGMVQFKPYFLGEAVPPNLRLASCQKCFRTTDIESVGDSTHLTFFEMLGNFSVGDYFKKETINWAWEFVTQRLKFPPERLWATIFLDDDESFGYWREIGIPEKRIVRFGEESNFWGPAGDSGPCGPCSEIIYDFGEGVGCGRPDCDPSCSCGRFSEIWNLVFTEFNQDKQGKRTRLPKPNIDTGLGLERTAAILQGKTSVYDTDLFVPLLKRVSELAGRKYGADAEVDNAMRVVTEHGRGVTFLIADGVLPSNEGAGYVLRRLLRRATVFSRRLGLDKPFLSEVARATIKKMGHVYPEIVQREGFILKVIESEGQRFSETLSTGLELLDEIIAETRGRGEKAISGKDTFQLYDTYGFPKELTQEVAAENGFSIDGDGFEQEMEKQRERARAAQKFKLSEIDLWLSRPPSKRTEFSGYKLLKQETAILRLLVDNESVEKIEEGQGASLILDTTPFYGEMGGQVGDTGEIISKSGRFTVANTVRVPPDVTVHQGQLAEGSLSVGDKVVAKVDRERRLDIARNHTATHLLHLALRQVLGSHAEQRGSLVAPDRLRFDFSHLTAMMPEEIEKVNHLVNEKIRQNLRVSSEEMAYKKAVEAGAIALFDEKYGEVVRVLKIGEPSVSVELCGGTHIHSTGEIGFFHILSESSIGSGLRRIEAVTGRGAEAFIDQQFSRLGEMAQALGVTPDSVQSKVSDLLSELGKERKRAQALERELARGIAESLLEQVEVVNGVKVLSARVPPSRPEALREMCDLLREKMGSGVVVLGTVADNRPLFLAAVTQDLVTKGYNAGDIVKQVARVAGGGGGGKPTLAQAGGKDKSKLDEALKLVKSLIKAGGISNA